jgi:hypothetical protein
VTLDGVTIKGIDALAKLEHLEEFLFHHDEHDTEDYKFFWLCLHRLPRLRVSGLNFQIKLEPNKCFTDFASKAFHTLKKPLPSPLALRQLVLGSSSVMPVGVVLPNLETLYLINPGFNFSLLGLSSVTELGLEDLNRQLFEQILSSIGHQLLSLAVSVQDSLFVDRVFQMCPKLQKFNITDLAETFVGLYEPLKKLKFLVEFGFGVKCFRTRSRFQPEHLLQILRAVPNLLVWRVKNYFFDKPECELISEALKKNSILRNLEQFSILASDSKTAEEKGEMEAADIVLRSLIDHCPKLSKVKVEISDI